MQEIKKRSEQLLFEIIRKCMPDSRTMLNNSQRSLLQKHKRLAAKAANQLLTLPEENA